MALWLTPEQRASLSEFLCYWFSFAELKGLAFELGVGFEVFASRSKQECAVGVVRALEHSDRLACLVDEVQRRVRGVALPPLPRFPACVPCRLVEVLLPVEWSSVSVVGLQRDLAVALGVAFDRLSWVAAAGKTVHLLVSLPEDGAKPSAWNVLEKDRYGQGQILPLEVLDRRSRHKWRTVACHWPPEVGEDRLFPAVSWARVPGRAVGHWAWGLLVGALLLVTGGMWVHDRLLPQLPAWWIGWQGTHAETIREAWLWLEFLGSVLLSVVALSWLTVLFFGLLAGIWYLLPHALGRLATAHSANVWLARLRDALSQRLLRRDWLVGTLLNLCAGGCALVVFSWATRRPLDYWDLAIQAFIALAIELVVLGVVLRV